MLSKKEKDLAIKLLEAKIERATGKKVTYVAESAEPKVKKELPSAEKELIIKLLEAKIERLTGKKVVYKENVAALAEKKAKIANTIKEMIEAGEMCKEEIMEIADPAQAASEQFDKMNAQAKGNPQLDQTANKAKWLQRAKDMNYNGQFGWVKSPGTGKYTFTYTGTSKSMFGKTGVTSWEEGQK